MQAALKAPGRKRQPGERETRQQIAVAGVRVAYLLSRYPAISHTFFLQEIAGLRDLGLHIQTASINLPDRAPAMLSSQEAEEFKDTFYLKRGSRLRLALRAAGIALRHPRVFLRGVAAVARLPRLSVSERMYWLFYLAEAMLLGDWLRLRGLSHLHVHFGGPVASVAMITSKAWKIPFSLMVHGPEELLNTEAYHLREKVMAASRVLCISDFCRSQLMRITPQNAWYKFRVQRLGVQPELLAEQPAPRIHDRRTVRIVCTGRLVPEKAQQILLEAVEILDRSGCPVEVKLIGDGPMRERLQHFARNRGLMQVQFLGALSHRETLQHVKDADIFVLPSFAEGIPVALMEAMALGVPCISTTIAGIPELIHHGHDGLLVPPANVRLLADAIALLASDAELRLRLGSAAQECVRRDYDLANNHLALARWFAETIEIEARA